MPVMLRIVTDTISITALITVGLYHLISYLGRLNLEPEKDDLFFSLLLFFIASYIFFDNSLSLLFFLPDRAPLINTVGVAFSTLGLMVFLLRFLYGILGIYRKGHPVVWISGLLGCITFSLSFFSWFKGYLWYMAYLDKPAIGVYLVLFLMNIFVFGRTLITKKESRSPLNLLITFISVFIVISLFVFRLIIARDLENFSFNNHIPVAIAVLFFPAFLTVKSRREYRELILLKERLRKMQAKGNEQYRTRCERFVEQVGLNEREGQVLSGLLEGLEYKEIADRLTLSLSGVKKRIHSLYRKSGVQNRTELVNRVLEYKNLPL